MKTAPPEGDAVYLTGVSQYESRQRQPSAVNILTYQIIFGVSAEKLLPVLYTEVEEETKKRARALAETIRSGETNANTERKLEFLNEIIGRTADKPAALPWEKKTLAAS